jgi:hypothetical protein
MYEITDYTLKQAKKLGVVVKPAKNPKKKLDVFKNGEKIVSVGSSAYGDFPTFTKERGKAFADERRRLYKIRHNKNTGLASFYANNLLW